MRARRPRSVSKRAEMLDPLLRRRRQHAVDAVRDDLAIDADRRRHDRHAAGHALNGLEAALAARPVVVGQRIDADVAGVEQLHLVGHRPRHDLDVDAGEVHRTAGAADFQRERMRAGDRRQHVFRATRDTGNVVGLPIQPTTSFRPSARGASAAAQTGWYRPPSESPSPRVELARIARPETRCRPIPGG